MTNQGPDIVLIKSSDGSQVDTLRKTKGSIRFAEFSSDGKFLVAASDGERGCHWRDASLLKRMVGSEGRAEKRGRADGGGM